MPEDQVDQSDVKEEPSAEVEAQEAESSTVDNREQVDAEPANTEEQPAKPERTVPLNQHIADRTKHKNSIRERDSRIEELEAKVRTLEKPSTVEIPATNTDAQAPRIDDKDIDYDPAKFAQKSAAYEVEKAIAEERQRVSREAAQQELTRKLSAFDQNVAKLAADAPEYAELIQANGENGHGDDTVTAAIIDSDAGAEIDYYLLANPAEAARISGLPERAKLMEMGAIKAKAVEFASSNKKGATNQVTSAPRPIAAGSTGGSSTSDPRYDPNVSFADYRAAKNERAAG